ncbi:amino acid ABC transporter permease [Bradyrhizobium lablabi]|uniref:Amino acid ABC transporter permease n=1 Tax=Bradyrhizobium lablabi TaxID=722472 RepID=A0A0R3MHP2_9BRAD|nr:amino acid ABC transporter permease [Bradyrhizobium lablabi]KRR16406.1 amino acid ABC transporter permease [Bradyrhizobium lablabi]
MTSISEAPQNPLPLNSARSRQPGGGYVIRWLRANLFASVTSSLITVILMVLLGKALISLVQWGYWNAVWSVPGDQTGACRSVRGLGACWAVIPEKYRFILFGTYPFDQQWRPALACLTFIALFFVSSRRSFWRRELVLIWAAALVLIGILMWGGIFGLTYVSQDRWGGLPVTLILATFGLAFGFPLGIVVALGRRSKLPAIRSLCVLYVELIRGVPLISLLFMASVMFPLFMPDGVNIDKLLRAQIAFVLFAGAYLAEVIRGGLQAVPRGQHDAADALGLSYWKKNGLIILPQAIRHVIPPLVNTFIAFFKDTSLVLIIGIFDLLTTAKTSIIDPAWQPFSVEVYLFVAVIYFLFCFAMSRYSRRLEAQTRH